MRCVLASVSPRTRGKSAYAEAMTAEYLSRITGWLRAETKVFATETALLASVAPRTTLTLLDERGKLLTSRQFSAWLAKRRDGGTSAFVLAVGPADGWSQAARDVAAETISLGPMTLPHELARAVAAEQLYRAWTILENHPYHRE